VADGGAAQGEACLVQDELVDLALAADDRFAQAPIGGHHHLVEATANGIDAEADSGDAAIHHALHHDRHRGGAMLETPGSAIGDRPVLPEGDEAILDRREQRAGAATIEKTIVLAREGGAAEILQIGR
jgi:hypothetical protein